MVRPGPASYASHSQGSTRWGTTPSHVASPYVRSHASPNTRESPQHAAVPAQRKPAYGCDDSQRHLGGPSTSAQPILAPACSQQPASCRCVGPGVALRKSPVGADCTKDRVRRRHHGDRHGADHLPGSRTRLALQQRAARRPSTRRSATAAFRSCGAEATVAQCLRQMNRFIDRRSASALSSTNGDLTSGTGSHLCRLRRAADPAGDVRLAWLPQNQATGRPDATLLALARGGGGAPA
jgi:hypothetical protein